MNNPKLEGSNIIDSIPQIGICPNKCNSCFYNEGFFRPLDTPLIPTIEEAEGKIVRVNSGHDSNLQKKLVIETTKKYTHKFYNTSIPDFNGFGCNPIVYTCNPRDHNASLVDNIDNLMAVRIRVGPYNVDLCDMVVLWYTKRELPVILTFMRFKDIKQIPERYEKYYYFDKHILNSYYCLVEKWKMKIRQRYHTNPLVFACGITKLCKDCGICSFLYWRFITKEDSNGRVIRKRY